MTNIKIEISHQAVTAAFNNLLQLGQNPVPALDAVGRLMLANVERGFRTSTSPYGAKWDNPKYRSGKPLIKSGQLLKSISYRVASNAVEIGTNKQYAAIQQFGGVIKPKNKQALFFMLGDKKVFARQVTIPARPFLPTDGLPASWADDAADAVMDVLHSQIG